MIKSENKFMYFTKRLFNLFVVMFRLLVYSFRDPRILYKILFSYYSTINEFYQVSCGKLIDFNNTQISKDIEKQMIFSRSNYYNMDEKVMRPVEIQIMSTLIQYLKPQNIFEIGTYSGFTTLHFCYNTDDDAKIYTLDLPPDYVPEDKSRISYDDKQVIELSLKHINSRIYKGSPCEKKVVELFGDSMSFDYTPYEKKIDIVFVDGNHSHDYVKSDTENAFKMLSEKGVILWHDFDYIIHRDVFKYLNKLSEEYDIYSIRNTRFALFGRNIR